MGDDEAHAQGHRRRTACCLDETQPNGRHRVGDPIGHLRRPARHDVARRVDCGFLARLVAEHQLDENEAVEVAHALAYDLARKAYRL